MRLVTIALLATASACSAQPSATPTAQSSTAASQAVTLTASDGVKIFGTYYPAAQPKALILLFHQAGSGKGEYATIAPRLAAAGYSALAIDQRAGGGLFGRNETATALGREVGYLEALRDLQAALDWAEAKNLPVALWGSSYSSSLIFRLAADNPGKAKALLAFSPGEYFDDKHYVRAAAAKVSAPVFVTSAPEGDEVAQAKTVFDGVGGTAKTRYVPKAGVHGSSSLIAAKNPDGAAANWTAVMAFLKKTLG